MGQSLVENLQESGPRTFVFVFWNLFLLKKITAHIAKELLAYLQYTADTYPRPGNKAESISDVCSSLQHSKNIKIM